MTEAEIKAIEYGYEEAQKLAKINENCHAHFSFNKADIAKAFQDGAEWGMEHAIEWHDLRKDPNDLPKREYKNLSWSITVANQHGVACHYNHNKSRWETPCFTEIEGVIKWCELPQFKDKE